MRLRKLALAVGLAGVLSAEMASALGLGEIKLLSTLNQPLEAEIKLLQANDLSENEILIGLAANEDFKRAGIDRLYFLTDLKFTVQLDRASGPVIRVSSKKPVREPYLNFLLETQWPNGRILREYTLLMDLPVFSDDSVRPVESARSSTTRASEQPRQTRTIPKPPQTNQAEETSSVESQESQASRTRAQSQSAGSRYGADVYGPVGASDTLWEIALKVRPTRGHSVQQTMLAIQRLNPEAFINGNINLLRKGQVLRVPDASDIDAVTARQAVSEVAYQNNQWSDTSGSRTAKAQLDGSKRRSTAQTEQQSVSGRLKVAGAEARENLEAGRAAGEVGGDVESLQNDLAISLEELDRSRRENGELQDRVGELEEQIQTMERLLEVSSQELRALQLGAKDNQQAASAPAEVEGQESAQVEESSGGGESEAEPMAEEAVAKAEVTKPDPSKVVRRAQPPEPSFMDMVMDNILYIGGGLVAILAGAFLFLRRRKEDEQEDDLDLSYDEPVTTDDPVADEEPFAAIDEPEQDQEAIEEESIFAEEAELDLDDAVPTESQTGDAVGEADIYIAYGKFDQAEEMLLNALSENNHDTAARLKLMEVYVETQDLQKFDEQYSAVQADGNPDTMARASDLREQFDNAPAYIDMPAEDTASVQQDDLQELGDTALAEDDSFDFDLGGDSEASSDTELSLDEDFGLSFESNLTGEAEPQEAGVDESEEFSLDIGDDDASALDDDLSFDLDLSDDLVEAETENAAEEFDLGLDSPTAEESDLSLELDDSELSLDLDETAFDSGDLELALETDSGEESPEAEFDLDLDLDAGLEADTLSLDSEAPTLDLEDADLSVDESPVDALDMDLSLSEDEALAVDSDLDSAFELDVDTADDTDTELELAAEGLDVGDLEADLASLDSELSLDAEDAETEFSLPAEEEEFDLSLDDSGDAFDVDMGDIDLDTLDQEVDAMAADLDVPAVDESTASEGLEASTDFDFDLEGASSGEANEATSEDSLSFDSEELSLDESFDLDVDVPTLGADLSDEPPVVGAEEVAEPAVEVEPEFDLAADLGLSADDIEGADQASDDEMFTEALSDLPTPEDVMADDGMTDEDLDAELDFLADTDEAATKLDLARAYIDMGDQDGAKDILDEVVQEGNDDQKQQAEELLSRMS
ncbi:MAG: hypothetical protein CL693_19525 [Cellvibrionaceae bacterium]|nr:hypothetical protein [Cellvibrionaceae bacterium]|tara:strand:- start:154364 stop:157846 length:3483 start_codon:yes stop_codon:yes gene_type:complete